MSNPTVTYFGTNTLLIRDDDTRILIDPHFTRCSSPLGLPIMFREIKPDRKRILQCLADFKLDSIDAILVTHSHYDHVLDVPIVARETGAKIFGTDSTRKVAQGGEIANDKIITIDERSTFTIGEFEFEIFKSKHTPLPFLVGLFIGKGTKIKKPVKPPAKASIYREGGVLSFAMQHPKGTALIMGSTGPFVHREPQLRADVAIIPVSGLALKARRYARRFYKRCIRDTGVKRAFISHWDDFAKPIDEPIQGMTGYNRNMRLLRKFSKYGEDTRLTRLNFGITYSLFD